MRKGKGGQNFIDLTGQRFGYLTVIKRVENRGKDPVWKCRCECGNEPEIRGFSLRSGNTVSCGCKHFTHGVSKHRFFKTWRGMMMRCYDVRHEGYRWYGARGIKVCDDWHDPRNFTSWCDEYGEIPKGYTLDRFPNKDGDYFPENCRFASKKEQAGNMKTNVWIEHNGERLIFKDFVEKYGVVSYSAAKERVRRIGMSPKDAALTPSNGRGRIR